MTIKTILQNLTDDQARAVSSPAEGSLKIIAGAGSGKTEVLTRRVAALLLNGVAPRELVAITYTRKAAAEMKLRLVEKRGLSPRLFHEMEVNTFHGFLSGLLRRDPFSAGLDGADATITETARQLLLEEILFKFEATFAERLISADEGFEATEAQALVKEFPHTIGKIRRFLLSPASFQTTVRHTGQTRGSPLTLYEQRVLDWLHRYYMMFLSAMQDRRLMDFDEILLRGETLVREWRDSGYLHASRVFLIDEFQDNNLEQLRTIERLLAGREGHLTVVGDFRQSIYRFQGADVAAFTGFKGTTEIILRENFRSFKEIVDLANSWIGPVLPPNLPPDQISQISRRGPSPRPHTIACLLSDSDHPREHASAMARMIRKLVDSRLLLSGKEARSLAFGDIAIIVPSIKRLPASFEDPFIEQGIPYQMSGGLGFYDRSEIAEMVAFLRLLANPFHDHSLVKILTGPLFGLTDSELARIAQPTPMKPANPERGNPEPGVIPRIPGTDQEPLWIRMENRLRADPEGFPDRAESFFRFFSDLQNRRLTMSVLDLVYFLMEEAGFREHIASQKNDLQKRRMENNLSKFIGIVRSFEQSGVFTTLHDFLAFQDRVLSSDVDEEEAGLGLDERGSVKIMTIHKAKGLEFPLVFLPNLKAHRFSAHDRIGFSREEGLLVRPKGKPPYHPPCNNFIERERRASAAEDRRKLYVAFTRAEELLVVTGSRNRSDNPDEPLHFIRTFLETNPDRGAVSSISDADALCDAWLATGTHTAVAAEASEAAPVQASSLLPDIAGFCDSITAVEDFLERPKENSKITSREEVFSLVDLTRFRACPRRYFFFRQHLAPLVERDISEGTMVGNLVHHVLRIFHAAPQDCRPQISGILDRIAPLYGPNGEAARPKAARILERYLSSQLASIRPWLLEAEVNIRLESKTGPFLLRGFADRVDRDGPDVQIVDYKTHGFSPASHEKYERQMALYLAAAKRGILGDLGSLNFPEVYLAYMTELDVDLRKCLPDLIAFEKWAVESVEAIRRETSWQAGSEAPCSECGFLVLCERHATSQN
ncbi:hypothetical protein AUK22_11060 [bacterium CG2_30_54_10]|nr:MAG: hypothetical protein AUK22_11060 [bacterium CG2_30_54_10]